jgi:hypothetical protein
VTSTVKRYRCTFCEDEYRSRSMLTEVVCLSFGEPVEL